MKTLIHLLLNFLMMFIGVAFIRTAFGTQEQLFIHRNYYDEMHTNMLIGGIICILIGSILIISGLRSVIKGKTNKIILISLLAVISIGLLLHQRQQAYQEAFGNETILDPNESDSLSQDEYETNLKFQTSSQNAGEYYTYSERLLKFTVPFELREEFMNDSLMTLKGYREDNFSVNYFEIDDKKVREQMSVSERENFKANFENYLMPKKIVELSFKLTYGQEINPDLIKATKLNNSYHTLSCSSEGYICSTIYQSQNEFHSLLIIFWKGPDGKRKFEELIASTEIIGG